MRLPNMKLRILFIVFSSLFALELHAQSKDCPDSCEYYVPNTLTPDCDQADCEILEIVSNCSFKEYKFKLFNRWGEIIFESEVPEKKFDSTDHKEGTYFWTLEGKFCNSKDLKGTGYINILR